MSLKIVIYLSINCRGNLDVTKVFPFLGKTDLEVLSVIGAFLLVATHLMTALSVKEKVVVSSQYVVSVLSPKISSHGTLRVAKKGLRQEFKEIWDNARSLPPVIRQIVSVI